EATPEIDQFGDLSLSGTFWIDESSKLPTQMAQEMSFDLGNIIDEEIPFEKLVVKQDGTFYDYNEVKEINLPEEAKNAKSFEELLEGELPEQAESEALESDDLPEETTEEE